MPAYFDSEHRLVSEKAAEWYFRLEAGDLTAAELKDLLQWFVTPSHCDEFTQIARIDALVRNRKLEDRYGIA